MVTTRRTGYDTPDGKPLWGAAKIAREKALHKGVKAPKVGKPCACGCGETTKGGEFCMGHDARHKSALIREAKADNMDAVRELERRGWTKFLEKSVNNDERTAARVAGIRIARPRSEEDAVQAHLAMLAGMKRAHAILREIGRAPRAVAGDRFIMTTHDNYEAILTADLQDLDDDELQQIRVIQGLDAGAKV